MPYVDPGMHPIAGETPSGRCTRGVSEPPSAHQLARLLQPHESGTRIVTERQLSARKPSGTAPSDPPSVATFEGPGRPGSWESRMAAAAAGTAMQSATAAAAPPIRVRRLRRARVRAAAASPTADGASSAPWVSASASCCSRSVICFSHRLAQGGQAARNPRADRPLADAGQLGDLGVLQLLVVTQHDRGALRLGEALTRMPQPRPLLGWEPRRSRCGLAHLLDRGLPAP